MNRRNFLSITILGVSGLAALGHKQPELIWTPCGCQIEPITESFDDGKWTWVFTRCPRCGKKTPQGVYLYRFEKECYDDANKHYQNSSCLVMMNQPKG